MSYVEDTARPFAHPAAAAMPWRDPAIPAAPFDAEQVAAMLNMSKRQLADTLGLAPATLMKSDRATSRKAQSRIGEMLDILHRVDAWAGGMIPALAWYRAQPIAPLDGRTAESLVKTGLAAAVRDYCDQLALGGFA